jgi:methylamine dehydrogenase heavy chain
MSMTSTRAMPVLWCAPVLLSAIWAGRTALAAEFPSPLPPDPTLQVSKLPAKYPSGWAFLNYAGDRIELRNVGADSREVKAQLQARDSTTLLVSDKRPEVYTADTVWSRGVRGTRTDFITVYDSQTLNVAGEIVLPGTKRALITAMEGLFAFTDDERMALVFNFTPAASVTVVDLVKRQPLGEIDIPGCSLVYPAGARAFSTLCSSGTVLTIKLDANGQVAGRSESKPFNPLDTDPLFTASTVLNGIRYFPSLHGRIQPIDMKTDDVKVLPDWPLVSAQEKATHWRPKRLADPGERRKDAAVCPDAAERRGRDAQESRHRSVGVQSCHEDACQADPPRAARVFGRAHARTGSAHARAGGRSARRV